MTPKISLVLGIVTASLAVGVPSAFAEGRLAGSVEPGATVAPDWFERAAGRGQVSQGLTYRDAHERGAAAQPQWLKALNARSEGLNKIHGLGEFAPKVDVSNYRDAFERGVAIESQSLKALHARSVGLNKVYGIGEFATNAAVTNYRDAFERAVPPRGTVPVSAASSGREIEWPQIGIGFGMGLLLMLGVYLVVRSTRQRPLAH